MKACSGERIELVTPRVPAFWKAVAQQNKRALALLDDIQADTILALMIRSVGLLMVLAPLRDLYETTSGRCPQS